MKKTAKPSRTLSSAQNAELRAILGGEEAPQDPGSTLLEANRDRAAQAMDGYIRG